MSSDSFYPASTTLSIMGTWINAGYQTKVSALFMGIWIMLNVSANVQGSAKFLDQT